MNYNFTSTFTNKENCYRLACPGAGIIAMGWFTEQPCDLTGFDNLIYCDKEWI